MTLIRCFPSACDDRRRMRLSAVALVAMLGTAWMPGWAESFRATVVDAATSKPIVGATVVVRGLAGTDTAVTGEGGTLTLLLPDDGTSVATSVRAPGYLRLETSIERGPDARILLTPFRPRAVYLSVFGVASPALREDALALQGRTAINALVIDVKGDRGLTPYRSSARDAAGATAHATDRGPTLLDLPGLLRDFHARHLYLIARIVVFKDDPLVGAHPEWAVRDSKGAPWRDREHLRWVDPFQRAAWEHNLDLAEEAAKMGFDEIQFDYMRFPDATGLQFIEPSTREGRVSAIGGFLQAARKRLQSYNVYLSADIFGYVCWNLDDTAIGQQVERLGASLDYISPMLYPSAFTWGLPGCQRPTEHAGEIVARSLTEAKRRTGLPGVRFRPWLQGFRDYAFDHRDFGENEIRLQVEAADAAGTDGWMLWNPRNHYDPATLPR